ncbi:hypothetical protein GH714_004999 [Hevea brasiliensis]|uniref:SPARK domain-containing protein n=1 Tax=Hevea brasiliensis TaxID=3981 RepID=A0A6A6L0G6_HEVBR|nr:hypothetical protein GH714_004999 [Hevea brasiliensis]
MEFVLTPNICAHVQTAKDWVAKLGNSTVLDSDCRPDLVDLTSCSACVAAGFKVQSDLILIDGNKSHATDCFYFTVLYAAGIVNEFGPESDGAVTCIFGLDLESNTDSSNKGHSALVFGLTGAGVAILVMSSLLGLYFWYDEKRRKKNNSSFPFDSEEQGSRPRLRPNTGSTWFKIHDLEKATENFSQKNFIGRGGFGLVYKGILSDGTTVAVKRIIESDIQGSPRAFLITDWVWSLMKAGKVEDALDVSLLRDGEFSNSNPRAIMERFVLVGILCAHVMVALRPTISDALKMLEGDIEVPPVPDRPMPLSHPSSFGDGFTISPALSFPQLNSGDMLRRDVEKLIVDMEQIREEINKNVEESNRNAVECKQAIEGLATTVEGLAAAVGKLLESKGKAVDLVEKDSDLRSGKGLLPIPKELLMAEWGSSSSSSAGTDRVPIASISRDTLALGIQQLVNTHYQVFVEQQFEEKISGNQKDVSLPENVLIKGRNVEIFEEEKYWDLGGIAISRIKLIQKRKEEMGEKCIEGLETVA